MGAALVPNLLKPQKLQRCLTCQYYETESWQLCGQVLYPQKWLILKSSLFACLFVFWLFFACALCFIALWLQHKILRPKEELLRLPILIMNWVPLVRWPTFLVGARKYSGQCFNTNSTPPPADGKELVPRGDQCTQLFYILYEVNIFYNTNWTKIALNRTITTEWIYSKKGSDISGAKTERRNFVMV